jgi:alginate O-acetyltransferase complex protein AlgI
VLFTEPSFLFLFLPLVLGLYLLPFSWHRNGLLLVASIVFYASGGGAFTWLMLGSVAFNYTIALRIDQLRETPWADRLLAFAVAANLIMLGAFKYTNFAADNLNALLSFAGAAPLVVPTVLLPIGISFFTFHAISYVVDVYRRDASAQKSPLHAALYLMLFPQLIAGPIIRYHDIADQLARRSLGLEGFAYGVRRFVVGLAKKVLIANVVAGPADRIFALPGAQLTAGHAWLGLGCYTLQIYFDFSGYSDMAIGLGRMFGFRFPENFRYPYVADSVQDFWRRWHISLSTWFRDYLYVPLGGNRATPARSYANLVTVFFLCGLWHGASWNFVVWGLWHGLFLVLERLGRGRPGDEVWAPLRHLYTLGVVMIGWVFFRADTLTGALDYLRALVGRSPALPTAYDPAFFLTRELCLALAAGVIGAVPVVPALGRWRERLAAPAPGVARVGLDWTLELASSTALLALLLTSCLQIAARTYSPFIYFRF